MKTAGFWLLIAAFSVSTLAMDAADGEESHTNHHEHPGLSDAAPDEAGHAHGDSDDHHENPESPCHHHVLHCCCGHAHGMLAGGAASAMLPEAAERIVEQLSHVHEATFLCQPFHVPIS